jgi:poly(A)-specific ribonuclease
MRNDFNMATPFTQGVHYLSRQEEAQVRQKLIEDDQIRSNIPDMQLSDADSPLVEHIHKLVKEWQAIPKDDQDTYLNIPAEDAEEPVPNTLTRYQVRLTHQVVRNSYPNLKTQGMGHFVQITNPSSEQQANAQDIREQKREVEIANAIGFRWILEAIMGGDISKLPHYYVVAGHPPDEAPKDVQGHINELQKKLRSQSRALVGHNCLTDVINFYRCFVGDLPERVEDFSAKLQEIFPLILDTKYVASLGNKRWADTSLKAVETDLLSVAIPQVHVPRNFDRYVFTATYHEAGFDSFVTAKLGLKLPGKLRRENRDIKSLVANAAAGFEKKPGTRQSETKSETLAQLPEDGTEQTSGVGRSIVSIITAPVSTVRSILTGAPNPTAQEEPTTTAAKQSLPLIPASVSPTGGAVVWRNENSRPAQASKNGLQTLRTVSKKSNIYDMLEDEPGDEPEEEEILSEEQRIEGLVRDGKLIPRWEKDAAFWKLIGNKLQANATQEGILDLTMR